jgi:uncharacterized protein YceK
VRRVLVALVALAALAGCASPDSPTVVGQTGRAYLMQYPGVQNMPDSWPCGDHGTDTCIWLPKAH